MQAINHRLLIISITLLVVAVVVSWLARLLAVFLGDLGFSILVQSAKSPLLTSVMSLASTLFTNYPAALITAATLLIWLYEILKVRLKPHNP